MTHGYIAVLMFFVVSGYLISNALETFYAGRVREFAVNRFLRIYPSYWFVLAATVAVMWGVYGVEHLEGFGGAAAVVMEGWKASELIGAAFVFALFIGAS